MKVLILGGTQFVGRHIAEGLLDAGHGVSVFNRGVSIDELPPSVHRIRGDRDGGRRHLEEAFGLRTWDACVDVSGYTPAQVRPTVEILVQRVRTYVFISAVSVYGDPVDRPVAETHTLLPPADEGVTEVSSETYGPLKVACEQLVQEAYVGRAVVLRPQVVVGPHDTRGRYSWWIQQASQDDEMLAPGDGEDHLQVIDVHDVARFVRTVLEGEVGGVFNLAGHRMKWRTFVDILGARHPVWVPAAIIRSAGLSEFELPLYREENGSRAGLMDVSNDRARAAGLIVTSAEDTVRKTRAWGEGRQFSAGLPPELKNRLMAAASDAVSQNPPVKIVQPGQRSTR